MISLIRKIGGPTMLMLSAVFLSGSRHVLNAQEDPGFGGYIFIGHPPHSFYETINLMEGATYREIDSIGWGGLYRAIWLDDERIIYAAPFGTHTPSTALYYVLYNYKNKDIDSLRAIYGCCQGPGNGCIGEYSPQKAFVAKHDTDTLEIFTIEKNGFKRLFASKFSTRMTIAALQVSPDLRYAFCEYYDWLRPLERHESRVFDLIADSSFIVNTNVYWSGLYQSTGGVVFDTDTSFYYIDYAPGNIKEPTGLFHYIIGGKCEKLSDGGIPLVGLYGNRYLVAFYPVIEDSELWYYDISRNFKRTLIDNHVQPGGLDYDTAQNNLIYTKYANEENTYQGLLCVYSFTNKKSTILLQTPMPIFNPHIINNAK